MAIRVKTGRRASDSERQLARQWAECYRLAQAAPDKRYCLNPEDEEECQTFIYADDPGPLLAVLESFAKHGSFASIDTMGIPEMLIREELAELRQSGKRREDAILDLSEKYHRSPRTIERMVKLRQNVSPIDSAKNQDKK